jgi:hypothetical protein
VLVCGHTHHAALFTREGGFQLVNGPATAGCLPCGHCLINPGAVGQARGAASLASYDYRTTLRKLRGAKPVAQVVLRPPQGVCRRVEQYKVRWARYWAERQ